MEVKVTVENIRFYNEKNGYSVLDCSADGKSVTVVGCFPEFAGNEEIKFFGKWTEHSIYGAQFSADGFEYILPSTLKSIEMYLAGGLFKGIGPGLARDIVETFTEDTLRIIENEPKRLLEVHGIGEKKLNQIIESYNEHGIKRRWLMFLQSYGFSLAMSLKIISAYGSATEAIVKTNPYRLIDDIPGIGFKTADSMALKNGFPFDSFARMEHALKYILSDAANQSGDLYLSEDELLNRGKDLLNADETNIRAVLRDLIMEKKLIALVFENESIIQLPYFWKAEQEIAIKIQEKLSLSADKINIRNIENKIKEYEKKNQIAFSDNQKDAISKAVNSGLLLITGGPGTGKTTILNCVLFILNNVETVFLAAPTGRAAKRMSEAAGKEAKTIHKLLGFSPENNGFHYDESEKLPCDCLVVDESSMLDVFLLNSILKALKTEARLIMIGDADQLPSVGPGNILFDLIKSGIIPISHLTTLFRQAELSSINTNAQRINAGKIPIFCKGKGDFYLEQAEYGACALQKIKSLYCERLPNYCNMKTPIYDIQILASNKNGSCGIINLNKLIQNEINPECTGKNQIEFGDYVFRVGDKVINVKNDYSIEWLNPSGESGEGIFNGDIGYIHSINCISKSIDVCMDDGKRVTYSYNQLDNLELAYALTVHKSQGSEFDIVIMPVLGGIKLLNTRNLFYTAITRAKKMVVLVGAEKYIEEMVNNYEQNKRKSRLWKVLREFYEISK